MDERDRGSFESLVLALAATFRVEATASLKVGYWLGLRDLSLSQLQTAVGKAMATCRYMPTPRELRDLAGIMSADQRAIVAWNAVKQAIREQGRYRSIDFDDPAVNAAVRSLGGWPRLCGLDSDELDKWTSKEFQRLYRELSALQLHEDLTRYLPGVFESSGELTEKRAPTRVAVGTTDPARGLPGLPLKMLPGGGT